MRTTVARLVAAVVLATALTASPSAPVDAQEASSSDWRTVSAGEAHTCGIRTTGRLYCWGQDDFNQLGLGGAGLEQPTPIRVGTATNWTSVSAGGFHTCGVRRPGRLWCWGADYAGQVGNGPGFDEQPVPVRVGTASDWTSVSAGTDHTCGRRANGRIYCWGRDLGGQIGDGGGPVDRVAPRLVAGGFTNWVSVSAGHNHTCGRRANGRIYCWGRDDEGQIGDGPALDDRTVPTAVGTATNWTRIDAGAHNSCGRRRTGHVYCWGDNADGDVGDGTAGDQPRPRLIAGGFRDWVSVSVGAGGACARRSSGRLYCWGRDSSGQLGNGDPLLEERVPVPIAGGATDWTMVDAGGGHNCARTRSGRLYCWGLDADGRLGDGGTNTNAPRPRQVSA